MSYVIFKELRALLMPSENVILQKVVFNYTLEMFTIMSHKLPCSKFTLRKHKICILQNAPFIVIWLL